ncbi:Pimeloyl-ACP methyl ester carboxylesterase [Actinopolymorpha cephalotaxi]|uniref:Pimeloyl-ACP methyl ester carboxylesterase n=1 Tax=Actinopolymorpha cephalotaxi TaxID=504797 RepID=A0A1I2YYK6_9ACTN|nr:alpha/beta hydrolase [Actinopolymorpha cephalotaxi]NYH81775.1 pimeloyl-ACP methyl ester carboxylesterase [Actinopolymorpha cephalotaxi]SFH30728.1 Pimeloyl-ACP methyl ester carboxylesterase [Actinopolymorpha cephalotaxi]
MSTPRFLDLPAGVRSARLGTSRGEFAVLEATPAERSSDGPGSVALLLPGWTGSKEDFLSLLPALARTGRRAVAVDQRGQYDTAGPDEPSAYDLNELGLDAYAMAEAIDAGPAHLVGHSFGGLVARAAVLARPDRFASLTLLGSGPAGLGGQQAQLLNLMVEAIPTQGLPAVYAAKRELERRNGAAEEPAHIEEFLARRFRANNPVSLTEFTRQLVEAPDLVAELASTGVPTMVAFGVDDDAWSPAVQREMADRLGAPVHEIDGAGHSPAVDRPDATAEALTAYWDSLHRDAAGSAG